MNETKIIIGGRCSGKTTKLIEQSAKEQIYILTSTIQRARHIFDKARDMGLVIPFPVTVQEFYHSRFVGSSIRRDGVLIDDADDVLREFLSDTPIRGLTLSDNDNIERLETDETIGVVHFKDGSTEPILFARDYEDHTVIEFHTAHERYLYYTHLDTERTMYYTLKQVVLRIHQFFKSTITADDMGYIEERLEVCDDIDYVTIFRKE